MIVFMIFFAMKKIDISKKKWICKWFLFRFPRIAGIIFIAFISMFALDIFWNGYTFWQTVVGLFMHLIPTWILLIVLIFSRRKYPLIGAVTFGGLGLIYMIWCLMQFFISTGTLGVPVPYYLLTRPIIIALPAIAIGLSFFANRWLNRSHKNA